MKKIIAVLLSICQNLAFAQSTHTVTCSNVYMRAESNADANQIMLIPRGSKLSYIKETLYRERIELNGDNLPFKWYYVSYASGRAKKYGWVYAGCLNRIANTNYIPSVDKNLQLTNRHMFVGFCELSSDQCNLDCACDCCSYDLFFLANGMVIREDYCCCEGPIVYKFGKYASQNGEVSINFAKKTMEYDEESHKVSEHKDENNNAMVFKIATCSDGMLLCPYEGNDLAYMTTGKRGAVKQKLAELRKIGVLKKQP